MPTKSKRRRQSQEALSQARAKLACLTSCSSGEEHEASILPSMSSVVADDLKPVDMLASVPT